MPGRRKYGRRPRRRRRRAKAKVLRLTSRQARTKKYDSVVERVCARVARIEIQKNEVRLISRKHILGTYDRQLFLWTNPTPIDVRGVVIPMSRIPLTNVTMQAAIPALDIPETMENESLANTGLAMGILTQTAHGYRSKDFIRVSGFSLFLRAFVERRVEATVPAMEYSELRWRLVSVRSTDAQDGPIGPTPGWKPDPWEVLIWPRPDGYSAKLDHQDAQLTDDLKTKILCRGRVKFQYRLDKSDYHISTKYCTFKKPILIQYRPGDQSGGFHESSQLFLVFRSNVSSDQSVQNYRPRVCGVTKLHYKDV